MKYTVPLSIIAILLSLGILVAYTSPAEAGEPTGKIGPMNPTMFKCVRKDGSTVTISQPDPFRKVLKRSVTFSAGGDIFPIQELEDFVRENPDARETACHTDFKIDWGFDPTDAQEFNAHLKDLESACDEAVDDSDPGEEGRVVPITNTRIEGFVYEFHPRDPANPAQSEWYAVPSKSVMVQAKGIDFEIYWGSGEEGGYIFQHLGAGPIILNLQLPPDAHPINPDVVVFASGGSVESGENQRLVDVHETWTVFLGFYRGNVPPPDPANLKTPDGNFLPFLTLEDIEQMSECGYSELPAIAEKYLPPEVRADIFGMPDVGGTLEDKTSLIVMILASVMAVALPVVGIVKVRRHRSDEKRRR